MCAGRLGKGCALALYRVQDQAGRLALACLRLLERVIDLLNIVAVGYVNNIPAECVKLGADTLAVAHNVGNRAVQLTAVVVHETNEVIQLVVCGKLRAFPDLALVTLAVAYGNVNTARMILRTIAERRAEPVVRSTPMVLLRSVCDGKFVFGWLSV